MKSNYFKTFSLMIEEYPVEIFTFEILIGILFEPVPKTVVLLFGGVLLTAVFSELLKLVFKEKRPEEALKRNFYRRTFRLNRRSFPSSHAAVAAFFPTLFFGNILFLPFLLFALIVMYSRIYIKSHYVRDIIGGALVGIFTGLLMTQAIGSLRI